MFETYADRMGKHPLLVIPLIAFTLAACANQPASTAAPTAAPAPVLVPEATATNAPAPATSPTKVPATAMPSPAPTLAATPVLSPPARKPNHLFILADDLNADEVQYMPKLKALISDQGETFPNYFVPESLCCPSRATTLRGQYPHNTRVLSNDPPSGGYQKFFELGEEQSTIAVWLKNAGYDTMLAGKYLNGYPLKSDPLHIPAGWSEWYSSIKGNPYSEYNYTLNENGRAVEYGKTAKDYGTDVYVSKALDFINRSVKSGKPFFVYLAPYAPHGPYIPAPRHADLFPGVKAPRTANWDEPDVTDKPGYIRNRPHLSAKQVTTIDTAFRMRLQALQAVDEGIETLVNALKANGALDNTYIVFTSDNGYHLGNHRQVLGKIAPYEEELRVSMRVRGPGVPAGVSLPQLVGNLDLAPTFAQLAGATPADFVDGRSLLPLLRANPPPLSQWRQAISLEWGEDPLDDPNAKVAVVSDAESLEPADVDETEIAAQAPARKNLLAIPHFRGLRLQGTSYVEYLTGEKELYDITTDPFQLVNKAPTAPRPLLSELDARVKALATCKAATCRQAEDALFTQAR